MRRLRFIPALLVILLSACNEKLIETYPVEGTQVGEVVISLSSDIRTVTKADGGTVNVDDFWVEIFNSKKIRLFSKQYSEAKNEVIRLNTGDYRLLAKLGDSLGVGFDKPFYMADVQFPVNGGGSETVTATASLANVKMAVEFGENLKTYYTDGYYAIIRHNKLNNKSVKFTSDETRNGYIPAGELVFELYAEIDGTWKYYAAEPVVYSPRDYVTFNVDAPAREGELVLNILIDNEVDEQVKEIEVPLSAASALPPSITASSFDESGCFYVTEGKAAEADYVSLSWSASAGIKSCVLEMESELDFLSGLASPVDFCAMDNTAASAWEDAGFFWASDNTDGVIDFSRVLPAIGLNSVYTSRDAVAASFTLTVTDNNGKSDTKKVDIKVSPDVSANVIIPDYDVWAKKVVEPHVEVVKANNPSLLSLQYSADGSSWTAAGGGTSSGDVLGFNTVTGLKPATSYRFRAVYDGWYPASDVLTVTTEEAAQVGNAGFEEWTEQTHVFTPIASGSIGGDPTEFKYYLPFGTDRWWDANTKASMPSSGTGWTSAYVKCFPCAGLSTDSRSGSYSAFALVVNVGDGNTSTSLWPIADGTNYVGEFYLGISDDSGNHKSDYHAFLSRPSKLRFYYKYSPKSSETFLVKVELKASNGTVLTSTEVTGGSASEWTEYVIPFNYEELKMKSSDIYISFKASSKASGVNTNSTIEINGGSYKCHAGSQLRIDDIELIYE